MEVKYLRHPVFVSLALLSSAAHVSTADSGPPPLLLLSAQPEPLSAAEERDPALLQIAARFNPAMALPIRDVWPVEVRYAWHDGADLVGRIESKRGPAQEFVAVKGRDLDRTDWSRLPHHDARGEAIRYYLDAPGDDRPGSAGVSRWRQRFREIAQPWGDATRPAESPYPPTQYVHAYWWNRAAGQLALQYWFYYPFNEWVNHHEGDWEHIEVIVQGPSRLDADAQFRTAGHHYFFHDFWTVPRKDLVRRFSGVDPQDDHPLVYVGGSARLLGWDGIMSGGSYPAPARYKASAFRVKWLSPDEDTSRPQRFIAGRDFRLILMPEPTRLDAHRSPELSWLRLPFYVGQRSVFLNMPGSEGTCGRPPLQPAARVEWRGRPPYSLWSGEIGPGIGRVGDHHWPASWTERSSSLPAPLPPRSPPPPS
jgi:hypothetical protein